MTEPIIRVQGLTKRFGDFTAVDNLDLSVMPGSIYAFLGANGSGKSTTIRMLIGLLTPTAGEVEVDGVDVLRHPRRVRDRIGYMGQRVSLYQGLTLQENVQFYGGLYNLEGRALARRWEEVGQRFDLLDAEAEKIEELPAGTRQRAGLAVAMLHRPRILFLDEPTAGVDVRNRGLFWEIIQDEAAAGVTVFVTTHFLEEGEFCDWVSFIDRGRLVANDQPERLRTLFAEGYLVRVEVDPPRRLEAARHLDASGLVFVPTDTGWTATVPGLSGSTLDTLRRLALVPGASVNIEQPEMTDVFRRVLQRAGEAA